GRAVGIILSGTGTDGTLGVRALKAHAGIVMAQEPATARFSGMPESAIATGVVDYVSSTGDLAKILIDYVNFATKTAYEGVPPPDRMENLLKKIFILIRSKTGQDFSQYKRSTILRRIDRRMAIHQILKLEDYVRFLQENPQEISFLSKELLIGVTRFFRDPDAWKAFQKLVCDELILSKPRDSTLRVWIVGCSTGEEAYSMAIVLREALEIQNRLGDTQVQIFATDIDIEAIQIARQGIYPENIAADVSPERLKRFFIKENGTYRIVKEIRETVIFAPQNVISDPPFTHLDILSCRNLLIYLSPDLQKRLIPLFHFALEPAGILFLGTAESISGMNALFRTMDGKWKIFQRREITPPQAPPIEIHTGFTPAEVGEFRVRRPPIESSITNLAQEWLLQQYAPPSVIVNENGDILYFHGRTGKYLEPHPGKAALN
ncbi:MAG TPA: CheR family methyltransferase, partial [Methanomicrobiales archaeon]|nr:CheR family methyltransferase [Methanomicrobiales archaeon]